MLWWFEAENESYHELSIVPWKCSFLFFPFLSHVPKCYRTVCIQMGIVPLCTCNSCGGIKTHDGNTLQGEFTKEKLPSPSKIANFSNPKNENNNILENIIDSKVLYPLSLFFKMLNILENPALFAHKDAVLLHLNFQWYILVNINIDMIIYFM